MKKITLFTALLLAMLDCFAQFHLSGQVLNVTKADTIKLDIPFIYGFNPKGEVFIVTNNQGLFKIDLPITEHKFATLRYKDKRYLLLLRPGKTLTLVLNPADTTITKFSGSAAKENKLLYALNLTQTPFFRNPSKDNPFVKLPLNEIQSQVVKPWLMARDEKLLLIQSSDLLQADKSLIAQEIKSNAITQLSNFARNDARMKRTDLIIYLTSIYKDASVVPDVFPAGPMFYEFADSYVGYLEAASFSDFQHNGSNTKATLKYYGISLDSANNLVSQKGKMYMNWLAIRNNFDGRVAEAMLAQAVAAKCQEKELSEVRPLIGELQTLFPNSKYYPELADEINQMEASLLRNNNNKSIQIMNHYERITSIEQVISQYKGKVVYLDIWGTWCPPCRDELRYNPQLKQYFQGKDIIFVYLDMDEDSKDQHWREFLKVNNLTGVHLRKSSADIQKFWEELQPLKDKRGLYPTYFIFDKNGKLVPETAKRPSEGIVLYKQIEKYL